MHEGSVVVECGLSCSEACGMFVPCVGIEPVSPELKGGFLDFPDHQGSLCSLVYISNFVFLSLKIALQILKILTYKT